MLISELTQEHLDVKNALIATQKRLLKCNEKTIATQKEVIALLEAQLKEANTIISKIDDYSNAVKALQERIK